MEDKEFVPPSEMTSFTNVTLVLQHVQHCSLQCVAKGPQDGFIA